jgi:hypothetical protein
MLAMEALSASNVLSAPNAPSASTKLASTAQKWRDLAQSRRNHLRDLQTTGRWKRYFRQDIFLQRLRDADHLCDRWDTIVEQMRPVPKTSTDSIERHPGA